MEETNKHQDASLDHILKYTGVFGGVQGLNILISIVRNKLASKLLGAAGFGMMGFYLSVSEFINSCSNLGIPISSVQHLSELFEEGDEARITRFIRIVRTWCLWTALLAFVICGIAAAIYDWRVVMLAPMVMSLAITGGEVSILKGMRRLKRVAIISLCGAIATFCVTIPFLWVLHMKGIILSLDCSAMMITAINLAFTLPLFPWRVGPTSKAILQEGMPLLRIGIPYVLTGIAGTGVFMLTQAFLREAASDAILGYYRAGYTIMISYAGIVFTAMEPDFFPRLSSVNHDLLRRNAAINQQIRACVLLMGPMLIALIMMVPYLLQMLYTTEFLPAEAMMVCMVFYMFLRCVSVPIAFIALSRGDSKIYLMMEVLYDLFSLAAMIFCYTQWQLVGFGIGLSLSGLFDVLLIYTCYSRHYKFRFEWNTLRFTLEQGVTLALAVAACLWLPTLWKFVACILFFLIAGTRSYRILLRESDIIQRLSNKIRKKLHL